MALVGGMMMFVGLLTAMLDIGMNGARYAGSAPWGLGIAGIGLIMVAIWS